jgi:integrase
MRLKLTPAFVQKPPQAIIKLHQDAIRDEKRDREINEKPDRVVVWDTQDIGFGLMVTAKGHKSYAVQYRHGRRSRRMHLKSGLTLSEARKEAKGILGAVAKGGDPLAQRRKAAAAGADTLRAIFEEYFRIELKMKRDAEGRPVFPENGSKLRSARHRVAIVERLVYPVLGKYPIGEIRRSDLIRLLDKIAEENGEVMSDHVLAIVRKVMNWHASRSDEFRSPIVRGMARTKPSERARDRVLSDDELRAVWRAAEADGGPWGAFLRFLLLTATRRDEARGMRRAELSNGDWLIPAERYKTKRDLLLPLSAAARAVLATVPAIGKGELVFTADGRRRIGGLAWFKQNFDAEVFATLRKQDPEAKPLPRWTLHDLRRTARTLMSRAGVDDSIAERCLGHVIGGVRGTYDRHKYYDEKKLAFEKLATLVESIVNPKENVLPMKPKKRRT